MKTVAEHDRPREKLQRVGAAALGDNELLAIVLGHGRANASALDIANAVLDGVAGTRSARSRQVRRAASIPRDRRRPGGADRRGGRAGPPDADARGPGTCPDHVAAVLAEMLLPQFGSRTVEQFGVVLQYVYVRLTRTCWRSRSSLDALLGKLIAEAPRALIVVAQITPLSFGGGGVNAFNAALPAIVDARAKAGEHVMLVDMNTGFPTSLLGDGVHPNQMGYERMAGVWYDAIGGLL